MARSVEGILMQLLSRWLVVLVALKLAPSAASASALRPPPNILLIVSDDQGWRDLGCFGRKDILTPRLDQLAREESGQPPSM